MTDPNAADVKDALASLASRPRFDADLGDVRLRVARRATRVRVGGLTMGAIATVVALASLVPLFARFPGSSHRTDRPPTTSAPTAGRATPATGLVTLPPGVSVPEGKLLLLVKGAEILRAGERMSVSLTSDLFPVAQDMYPLAMSPDGSEVLAQIGDVPSGQGQVDEQLVAVNVATGRTTVLWRSANGELLSMAKWSPDGTMVAFTVGTRDPSHPATLVIVTRATAVTRSFPGMGDVYDFDWKPYGNALVAAISATELRLLDVTTGRSSTIVMQHGDTSIDRALAAAGLGRSVQLVEPIWSTDGNFLAALANLEGSKYAYVPVVFTPRGRFVAMGHPSTDFPESLAWSPAADTLAYAQGSTPYRITELRVLDLASGQDRLVSGSNDRDARIIRSVAWSPFGGWLAVGIEPRYPGGFDQRDGGVRLVYAYPEGPPPEEIPIPDTDGNVVVAWTR
jgi:WD40 repeat protein